MGKIALFFMVMVFTLSAGESQNVLTQYCFSCHNEQQIPDNLIYKRYLMKYSTNERMNEAMFDYLKDPKKEHSIMPAPFFLKFPMKKKMHLDEKVLHEAIQAYLRKYDMKKRLVLDKSSK